jgi:hypothetical protein
MEILHCGWETPDKKQWEVACCGGKVGYQFTNQKGFSPRKRGIQMLLKIAMYS